jgi:MFS transporter, OFA family, oxalate/formate antiporter
MAVATLIAPTTERAGQKRWQHLILGVVCMIMIANLQYGWTLFVAPLQAERGWSVPNIQLAFTLFVAVETWCTPINGWLADHLPPHLGARIVIGLGGVLVALGWIINASAETLPALYLGELLSGFGTGAVYSCAVGTSVKWFKDHRGLAVGLTAAGFGAGAALTVIPIQMLMASAGYGPTFFWFGLVQGGIVLIVSQFIRNPGRDEAPAVTAVKVQQTSRSYTPGEMLRSPIFWVLYLLDVLMCAGGLIVTADLAPIAKAFDVSDATILGATTLGVALIFANVMNGAARPFFGWVSDNIGLSKTMIIAFALGAAAYFFLSVTGRTPWGLIFFSGMVFFCWGEIFSLFPAMCTDLFGEKFATTNTSLLYTAKGLAAFLVPLGSVVASTTSSWDAVLYLVTLVNIVAVVLIVTVARPAEIRHHEYDAALKGKILAQ